MAEAPTILCFGDSNTHGTCPMAHLDDGRRYDRSERWPAIAAAALGTAAHLVEEGHPGRTSVHDDPIEGVHKNGFAVLPAILESHRPLALVAIMLGTNDLKERFSVPAMDIALSLGKLADFVRSSETGPERAAPEVLLIAPPPIVERGCLTEMFRGGAAKSEALRGLLKTEAARQGAHFMDAGQFATMSDIDGIHFHAAAHAALGAAFADQARRILSL